MGNRGMKLARSGEWNRARAYNSGIADRASGRSVRDGWMVTKSEFVNGQGGCKITDIKRHQQDYKLPQSRDACLSMQHIVYLQTGNFTPAKILISYASLVSVH